MQCSNARLLSSGGFGHLNDLNLGSGRALKKWGKTLDCVSCFPLHFFRALPLPAGACFTTEQNKVKASLFVNSRPGY